MTEEYPYFLHPGMTFLIRQKLLYILFFFVVQTFLQHSQELRNWKGIFRRKFENVLNMYDNLSLLTTASLCAAILHSPLSEVLTEKRPRIISKAVVKYYYLV